MAWYDDEDIVREIEMLEEEEYSWIQFCKVAHHMMRFAFTNNIPNNYDIEQSDVGERLVQRVLSQPSGDDCLQLCRMRPPAFRRLVAHLKQHCAYKGTRHISAEQRLAFTLFILGHSAGMRLAHIFFGHSTSTIHSHFHYVLDKLYELSKELVKPHPQYMYGVEHHRPTDPRHASLMDCIGAIDGTHVPAVPPHEEAERYRNRKGVLTQNVLAVVDFNMCFTFASAGWEGSTHDSRMLKLAMEDPNTNECAR